MYLQIYYNILQNILQFFQVHADYKYQHTNGPGIFVILLRSIELVLTLRDLVKIWGVEVGNRDEERVLFLMMNIYLSIWIHSVRL